jgi:hypothetical protein
MISTRWGRSPAEARHGKTVLRAGARLMLDFRLYMAQRLSALIMAPLVIGHLAVMIYAVQGGLSAGEILGRTQGQPVLDAVLWRVRCRGVGSCRDRASHHHLGMDHASRRHAERACHGDLRSLLVMGGRAVLAVTMI